MQVKEKDIETKIKEVINNLRPYLQNDGGDVAFKKYENPSLTLL